jgi:hypothetical protein
MDKMYRYPKAVRCAVSVDECHKELARRQEVLLKGYRAASKDESLLFDDPDFATALENLRTSVHELEITLEEASNAAGPAGTAFALPPRASAQRPPQQLEDEDADADDFALDHDDDQADKLDAADLLEYSDEFGDEEDVNYDDGTGDCNFSSNDLLAQLSPLGGSFAELSSAHDEALACEAWHRRLAGRLRDPALLPALLQELASATVPLTACATPTIDALRSRHERCASGVSHMSTEVARSGLREVIADLTRHNTNRLQFAKWLEGGKKGFKPNVKWRRLHMQDPRHEGAVRLPARASSAVKADGFFPAISFSNLFCPAFLKGALSTFKQARNKVAASRAALEEASSALKATTGTSAAKVKAAQQKLTAAEGELRLALQRQTAAYAAIPAVPGELSSDKCGNLKCKNLNCRCRYTLPTSWETEFQVFRDARGVYYLVLPREAEVAPMSEAPQGDNLRWVLDSLIGCR